MSPAYWPVIFLSLFIILMLSYAVPPKKSLEVMRFVANSPSSKNNPPPLKSVLKEGRELSLLSTLADLVTHRFELDASAHANVVDDTFRHHTDIPGVLILQGRRPVGMISRRRFFENLGQLYGPAIFLNRTIEHMLDPLSLHWLQMTGSTSIESAAASVFSRPEGGVYEPIVVEIADDTYGLLDVRVLLIAQTQLFANLQRALRQMNDELEHRVQERTLELAQINNALEGEINRRKQVETDLIMARDEALEANRLKTEFVAHVSHELRTPLSAIMGFSEMLGMGVYGDITESQQEVALKISQSSHYLDSIVNDLLDQAQLAAGKFKMTDAEFQPSELVQTVLDKMLVLAERKLLNFTVRVSPELPMTLRGDKVRLEQLLLNLVSNAIKFTDRGNVTVRLFRFNLDLWAIEVSDTGRGISQQAQAFIFEPFRQVDGSQTRVQRGTGLGLAIVKQLATLMNGHIELNSQLGQGSRFTVFLPLPEKYRIPYL
jgi:signal transduction histidine kinase